MSATGASPIYYDFDMLEEMQVTTGGADGTQQTDNRVLLVTNIKENGKSIGAFGDDCACAIIKHTTPCGLATGASAADAYRKALACDPVSAFGSVIAS